MMPKKPKILPADDLRDFAVHLARTKVRAGELRLFETMQALEIPLKKVGWEIAEKRKAASVLRADVEYTPGEPYSFRGFRLRRLSDEQVMFWGSDPSPRKDWKALLHYLKKNKPAKFVVGPTVRQFVKEQGKRLKIAWSKDGKTLVRK